MHYMHVMLPFRQLLKGAEATQLMAWLNDSKCTGDGMAVHTSIPQSIAAPKQSFCSAASWHKVHAEGYARELAPGLASLTSPVRPQNAVYTKRDAHVEPGAPQLSQLIL